MINQENRQFGPRFGSKNWYGTRFHRGYQRLEFFHGQHGQNRHGSQWQQRTPEQQALRSSAAEVAQLFVIAARKSHGDAEKQSQLRSFLDRSLKELSDFIYGTSQDSK